jgi:hypothetical protein
MNEKEASFSHNNLNLNILFELLGHKETNYAFFAVSRIKVISKIIGKHSPLSKDQKKQRKNLFLSLKNLSQKHNSIVKLVNYLSRLYINLREKTLTNLEF